MNFESRDILKKTSAISHTIDRHKHPLSVLKNISLVFGVDFDIKARNTTSRIFRWYQKLLIILWVFFCVHLVVSFYLYDLRYIHKLHTILARKITDMSSFVVWCCLFKRRHRINNSLSKLLHLVSEMKCFISSAVINIFSFMAIVIPIMGCVAILRDLKDSSCMRFLRYYTINIIPPSENRNCPRLYPVMILYEVLRFEPVTILGVLFFLLCLMSRRLLVQHVALGYKLTIENEVFICKSNIEHYFTRYQYIIDAFFSIDQELSFPVFVLQVNDLAGLFAFLVRFASYDPKYVPSYIRAAIFAAVRAILSFFCVCGAAAAVHEADVKSKRHNEELWQRIVATGIKMKTEKSIILMVSNDKAFAFTSWGCFRFTKSFILSAVGSILTYSLLITQVFHTLKRT
ncbi:uncharacterized protein NPIL_421891 [Nephila pilipes]|uniref:Gustatory receptor n=1 Tax=Nephila pilipes TaxID=299642 RepID=A0A8X6JXT2_NEPPI|nr:uncharacterized protein NPIL_421891 [Nephila pilipes]